MERIRPSAAELSRLNEYNQPAFPDLDTSAPPSVRVSRAKPPSILPASEQPLPKVQVGDRSAKPKSRFALQREREAAEAQARQEAARSTGTGTERFMLDLDNLEEAVAANNPRLVGQVVEREGDGAIPLPPSVGRSTAPSPIAQRRITVPGFPAASLRTATASTIHPVEPASGSTAGELPSLLSSVSDANSQLIAGMSEEAILEEQRQVRELGLPEAVIRMLEARGRNKPTAPSPSTPSTSSTSVIAPSKPVRQPTKRQEEENQEEGSPEYIRRHFFPNEPSQNSSLQWMQAPTASSSPRSTPRTASNLVFDLQGILQSDEAAAVDHAHQGHQHHASTSSTSSFSVPTLLSLVISTVSAQRSTAFKILARILLRADEQAVTFGLAEWEKLRVECARCAGWGIRDANMGVRQSAEDLLVIVLQEETRVERMQERFKPKTVIEGKQEEEEVVATFLATDPFPTFARHFNSSSVPRPSLVNIVSILHSIVQSSAGGPPSLAVEELVACKGLLAGISKQLIALPWPPADQSGMLPYPPAISLLTLIARSSRDRARTMSNENLVDSPLRFFTLLPWQLSGHLQQLSYSLLHETLELYNVLGRYGIATDIRTKGNTLFAPLFDHCATLFHPSATPSPAEIQLASSWYQLIAIWTTAAIDPHATHHDIKWIYVQEWAATEVDLHAQLIQSAKGHSVLTAVWQALAAWMEGSKVNQPWRGETQRTWLMDEIGGDFGPGGRALALIEASISRLVSGVEAEVMADAELLASALRLSDAYKETANPPTPALFELDSTTIDATFAALVSRAAVSDDNLALWPIVSVLVALLPRLSPTTRLAATLEVIPLLRAGDEAPARELSNWVLVHASEALGHPLLDAALQGPALREASILRPFVMHSIITGSGGKIVGAYQPSAKELASATAQRPFCPSSPLLAVDWPLGVLNELLRSGTSPVFENLPLKWDSSELELVRSALSLMQVALLQSTTRPAAAVLVYDLIKVFMLEKESSDKVTPSSKSETDLFRDESVQYSMSRLLDPLTLRHQPRQVKSSPTLSSVSAPLERVSEKFSSAPFYSLYTDLVGLYDSISLGHPLFSQILLPPLAMQYAVDFRKLLWIDYPHLLKSIRLPTLDVLVDSVGSEGLSSYLFPVEKNQGLIAAYADALVGCKVVEESFLEFVALHHVVATLFTPLPSAEAGDAGVEKRRLLSSIVEQGSDELLIKLVKFSLAEKEGDEILSPPLAYSGSYNLKRIALLEDMLSSRSAKARFSSWKLGHGLILD